MQSPDAPADVRWYVPDMSIYLRIREIGDFNSMLATPVSGD